MHVHVMTVRGEDLVYLRRIKSNIEAAQTKLVEQGGFSDGADALGAVAASIAREMRAIEDRMVKQIRRRVRMYRRDTQIPVSGTVVAAVGKDYQYCQWVTIDCDDLDGFHLDSHRLAREAVPAYLPDGQLVLIPKARNYDLEPRLWEMIEDFSLRGAVMA